MALLELNNLNIWFPVHSKGAFSRYLGDLKAVNGVNLKVFEGETLGLVGESGCGKSTLGRAISQLVKPKKGSVHFDGLDLSRLGSEKLRKKRQDFQMVFQDPYASLNPRMTVYDTIKEPLLLHGICSKADVESQILKVMDQVGLSRNSIKKYPHEFSGGQRQRIAIARAISVKPKLLIADEAVSALDVSVQSQILNLLSDLKQELNLTMVFISHDLSVVRHVSDRLAVMYLGKIVELGKCDEIYNDPKHPYTQALLSAIPMPDPKSERERQHVKFEGEIPSPLNPPSGCSFRTRCFMAQPECAKNTPVLEMKHKREISCFEV